MEKREPIDNKNKLVASTKKLEIKIADLPVARQLFRLLSQLTVIGHPETEENSRAWKDTKPRDSRPPASLNGLVYYCYNY